MNDRAEKWLRGLLAVLPALVLSLVIPNSESSSAGVESPAAELATTYIGSLKGAPGSARIAVVVEQEQVTAYVCSSDQAFNEAHARWFKGKVADGGLEAKSADGQSLVGKLQGKMLVLTIKANGKELTTEATPASADNGAGLYRLEDQDGGEARVIGWVVDNGGQVVGAAQKGKNIQLASPNLAANQLGISGIKLKITGVDVGQSPNAGQGLFYNIKWEASTGSLAAAKITGFQVDLTAFATNPKDPAFRKTDNVGSGERSKKFTATDAVQLNGTFSARVTMQFELGGQKRSTTATLNKKT